MATFSRVTLMNRIPRDVLSHIFEYDNTYRLVFDKCMNQIQRFNYLIHVFRLLDTYPDGRLGQRLKAVARSTRKSELKSLCIFLRLTVPRKITRYRLSMRLFSHMLGTSFSFIDRQGCYIIQPHNQSGHRFI